MKLRSRLKHAAAGMLSSVISRNNDVNGYWALGLMYQDVNTPPYILELDLLRGVSQPVSDCADVVAERYAKFLRSALNGQEFEWNEVTRAIITFQFNAQVPNPNFHFPCNGDPVICTVALDAGIGLVATVSAVARCSPFQPNVFAKSGLPNRLPVTSKATTQDTK